jgi:hypothetical protein
MGSQTSTPREEASSAQSVSRPQPIRSSHPFHGRVGLMAHLVNMKLIYTTTEVGSSSCRFHNGRHCFCIHTEFNSRRKA